MTPPGSRSSPIRRRLLALVPVVGLLVLVPSCGDATPSDDRPDASRMTSAATSDTPLHGTAAAPTTPAPGGLDATATATPSRPGSPPGESSTIRFAVVGDSLTAGDVPLSGDSVSGRGSWVPSAEQDQRLDFVGGWAAPGAATAAMAAGVRPVDADVLVVMGGTNDVAAGVPWAETQTNLQRVVRTAAVPTVLLSAIPPRDDAPERAVQTNRDLQQLAASQGWGFVDPWADMSSDGTWIPATSEDGIHPVDEVAVLVGQRLAAALAAAG